VSTKTTDNDQSEAISQPSKKAIARKDHRPKKAALSKKAAPPPAGVSSSASAPVHDRLVEIGEPSEGSSFGSQPETLGRAPKGVPLNERLLIRAAADHPSGIPDQSPHGVLLDGMLPRIVSPTPVYDASLQPAQDASRVPFEERPIPIAKTSKRVRFAEQPTTLNQPSKRARANHQSSPPFQPTTAPVGPSAGVGLGNTRQTATLLPASHTTLSDAFSQTQSAHRQTDNGPEPVSMGNTLNPQWALPQGSSHSLQAISHSSPATYSAYGAEGSSAVPDYERQRPLELGDPAHSGSQQVDFGLSYQPYVEEGASWPLSAGYTYADPNFPSNVGLQPSDGSCFGFPPYSSSVTLAPGPLPLYTGAASSFQFDPYAGEPNYALAAYGGDFEQSHASYNNDFH